MGYNDREEEEEKHTDVANERMRDMFGFILEAEWGILEDEKVRESLDWYISTIIYIFEREKVTLDIGNFLMEQETKILGHGANRNKCHDIANKLSFSYHKLNTKDWNKDEEDDY